MHVVRLIFKGVTLHYTTYFYLHPLKYKSTVNLKYSPWSTVKPLHLFDHFKKLVKGQAKFQR